LSSRRPTGRLDPDPTALVLARHDLAILHEQAHRREIILLYEDEPVVWRFALPRRGWWRRGQRYRLPLRPLRAGPIKHQEALKRQTWKTYRPWSRISRGVLMQVIGAVQYGTSRVFYKLVPHFDAQECRQYIHQIMQVFGSRGKEGIMVTDRSGIHRAHKLDATLEHDQGQFRLQFLPAHSGHHLNPMEGFWRAMQEAIGAGRGLSDLHPLYPRTRQGLMAPQDQPIYEFHW
jgi:hypothetical protein